LCCSTLLRVGGSRHAFGPRQLPSKPCIGGLLPPAAGAVSDNPDPVPSLRLQGSHRLVQPPFRAPFLRPNPRLLAVSPVVLRTVLRRPLGSSSDPPCGFSSVLLLRFTLRCSSVAVAGFSSQRRRFFQVWLPRELPHRADHSVYLDLRILLRSGGGGS